jgi:hypothetical protein
MKEYIQNSIFDIFEKYHEDYSKKSDYDFKNLYKPSSFLLFGNYDLALLSLVDDNVFGSQKFKPNSQSAKRDEHFYSFNYQVINCNKYYYKESDITLDQLFNDILQPDETNLMKIYTYVSLTKIKVKNSLLIGGGVKIVEYIQKAIDKELKDCQDEIQYIILQTQSWHEFVLLLFSYKMDSICTKITNIRELCIEDIKDGTNEKEFDSVINETLLKNDPTQNPTEHVFLHTYTYLGIDMRKMYDRLTIEALEKEIGISVNTKWHIKPGYRKEVTNILNEYYDNQSGTGQTHHDSGKLIYGTGDIEMSKFNDFKTILMYYSDILNQNDAIKYKELEEYNIKTQTIPKKDITNSNKKADKKFVNHISTLLVKNYSIHRIVINRLDAILLKYYISKAVRQRVLKVINNFNDGIQDASLYIYFIDLLPFINNLKLYILNLEGEINKSEPIFIHEKINSFLDIFDLAYRNRIQHSNRTLELTDFSLDFNGGIQQVITSLDSIFKIIRDEIKYYNPNFKYRKSNYTSQKSSYLTYVSGEPGIYSGREFLQINIFQLIQPEIFLATIFKEALNLLPLIRSIARDDLDYIYINILNTNFDLVQEKIKYYYDRQFEKKGLEFQIFISLVNTYEEIQKIIETDILKIFNDKYSARVDQPSQFSNILNYITLLNSFTYDYFLIDQLNILYYFQGDFNLYQKWFWVSYLQEPLNYNSDGTIHEDNFCKALIRINFSKRLLDQDGKFSTSPPKFTIEVMEPYLNEHSQSVNLFINILFDEDLKTLGWFKFSFYSLENCRTFLREMPVIEDVEELKLKYLKNFKTVMENDIISSDLLKFDKNFIYINIIGLFQAYLTLLSDEIGDSIKMVKRDPHTGNIDTSMKDKTDPIFIDSHGGLYINKKFRDVYYKTKTTLYKVMYNIALYYKKELFKEHVQTNS